MARVTVEDCVLRVPNRFELVLLAAQRARDVAAGAQITLERDNDKNPVVALREIAEESISLDHLATASIKSLQKHVEIDEPEEDHEIELGAQQWPADLAPASEIEDEEAGAGDEELNEDMLFAADDDLAGIAGEALPDLGTGEVEPDATKR